MKRKIILLFFIALANCVFSQSASRADELFMQKKYSEAATIYENLLQSAPKNQLYLYRFARCLQEIGNNEKAIKYFEEAGERYSLRNFYLGELYAKTYRFEQAIEKYEAFLSTLDSNDDRIDYINQQITYCNNAQRYLKRVEAVIVLDSITSTKSEMLSQVIDIYKDRIVRYYSENGIIFSVQHLLDGWTDLDTIAYPINTDNQELNPCVLSDGVTMYFASNRDGGLGGFDIYCSRKTDDKYLTPENIGMPYNSFANDYFYIIDENENLAYFATDRNTAEDSVKIYTLLYNEIKQYVRDTTEDYIRKCAQLSAYKLEKKLELDNDEQTKIDLEEIKSKDSICFVINDNIIYTKKEDFKTDVARKLYDDFIDLENVIIEERQLLEERRKSYVSATSEEKMKLSPLILVAEKTLKNLQIEKNNLIKQIRRAEIKGIK